jgi:hypothetical protein
MKKDTDGHGDLIIGAVLFIVAILALLAVALATSSGRDAKSVSAVSRAD